MDTWSVPIKLGLLSYLSYVRRVVGKQICLKLNESNLKKWPQHVKENNVRHVLELSMSQGYKKCLKVGTNHWLIHQSSLRIHSSAIYSLEVRVQVFTRGVVPVTTQEQCVSTPVVDLSGRISLSFNYSGCSAPAVNWIMSYTYWVEQEIFLRVSVPGIYTWYLPVIDAE